MGCSRVKSPIISEYPWKTIDHGWLWKPELFKSKWTKLFNPVASNYLKASCGKIFMHAKKPAEEDQRAFDYANVMFTGN